MPGFDVYMNPSPSNIGPDVYDLAKVANSETWYLGDPVVYTTVTGSEARFRKLVQDDIDDLYQDGSANVAGLFGIAPAELATDSNGAAAAVPQVVTVASGVKPVYPLLSVAAGNPGDPVTGRMRSNIFTARNWLGGKLWEATLANSALNEVAVGIIISTIGGVPYFFWSSAATTKIGKIVKVNEMDPMFNKTATANVQNTTHNPRCRIAVAVLPAFNQAITNFPYDD